MSRTKNAALFAGYSYVQFGLSLVSGFILFPLVVFHLGAYNYGLWLATGEMVGYLMLSDLGVFTVLPWMVASRHGAQDPAGVARHVVNALGIGTLLGILVTLVGVGVWFLDPARLSIASAEWEIVREPLALLLVLSGVSFPLRVFTAALTGLQDVKFVGPLTVLQAALTVTLTATLILAGMGMFGLAVATGLPPLVIGALAGIRFLVTRRDLKTLTILPQWSGCRQLFLEGFGAWLGGLGVRLLSSSTALICTLLGRPEWGTLLAGTGKIAQVAQPMCSIIPDSGLIGISQLHGEGDPARTRRAVDCLILLYLIVPGAACVGLLAVNPAFVQAWLGPDLYAGHAVSALLAFHLLLGGLSGGLFKLTAVVGLRLRVGIATLLAGLIYLGLGYGIGWLRGLSGLAEASVLTSGLFMVPVGAWLVSRIFQITAGELVRECLGPWLMRAGPVLILALVGGIFFERQLPLAIGWTLLMLLVYGLLMRPLIAKAPWPEPITRWLVRLRLVPAILLPTPPAR